MRIAITFLSPRMQTSAKMGAVPEDLRYSLLPSSAQARSYTSQIYPSNGSKFAWQSKLVINVPTGSPGTWLVPHESLLQFTFHNDSDITVKLDSGAHSLFSRLEVYHGPNLVESIAEVDTLHDLLLNAQMSLDQRTGSWARVSGGYVAAAGQEVSYATRVNMALWGRDVPAGGSVTLAMQLPSSLVGCCASKYLPLSLMSGSDVRIELTMSTAASALYCVVPDAAETTFAAEAPSMYIDDVRFVAQINELESRADDAVSAAAESSGAVTWHATQWRSYISSIQEDATYANTQVAARFSSLNALVFAFKPAQNVSNNLARSASTETATLTQYQFRMGPNTVPSQPIKFDANNFAEIVPIVNEAFGISRSHVGETGIMWLSEAIASEDNLVGTTGYKGGSFCAGISTSSYPGSTESLMNSGANSISQLIFIETWFTEVPHDLRMYTFAQYDVLYSLADGLLTVRF